MNHRVLQTLARQWQGMVLTRDFLFALSASNLAAVVTTLFPAVNGPVWWIVAGFAVTLAILLAANRPWRIDAARVAQHLDRTYPEAEESSSLFLKSPEDLTLLERLQVRRLAASLGPRTSTLPQPGTFGMPPRGFLTPAILCLVAVLLAVFGTTVWRKTHPAGTVGQTHLTGAVPSSQSTPPGAPTWPKITGGGLLVTPPAYTKRAPRRVEGFSTEVEEGAGVAWTLTLDRPVREARLVFGEGAGGAQALEVKPAGAGVELSGARRITEPGLYHLAATLPDGTAWNPPELFALKVIQDHPPLVRIVAPAQARTEVAPAVPPAPPPRVDVEVLASDDYEIADIRIVATVAKGSGEAVKFREVPLAFDKDEPAPDGIARRLTRTLDLGALGLEPGDELYFFVQAYDNRQPNANRTRSETRFITLKGPQEKTTTTGKGLTGINLVPQYFRSERQIIIDTEKLIAERPSLPDGEFRDRANGLGIDQQLLRLRYGQLLGEELEGGNADHAEVHLDPLERTAPEQSAGPRAAASVTQRFLQEHEEQDRQGGTDEQRAAGLRPEHPDQPLSAGAVVAPFVDQHDSQDKSTYYDAGAKGTMRDALAAMWDAEKYLRTARPDEALAPEHRALDILKELQQSARAYVQHVGFEAPPIKIAQRRLAGDASDVPARGSVSDAPLAGDPAVGFARAALAGLPSAPGETVGAGTMEALRRVEPALTAAATRQPEVFLAGLQVLRRWVADAPTAAAADGARERADLQRALLRLLPPARALPDRAVEGDPALGGSYFRALSSANPEEGK